MTKPPFQLPTQDEIVTVLREHPLVRLRGKVERAFLVGSFAAGTPHADSDVDILLEVRARANETAEELTERYRQRLRQHFLRHGIKGKDDSVHPQWTGRRVDLYFTYDADAELRANPRPRVELARGAPVTRALPQANPDVLAAYSCDCEEVAPSAWAGRVVFHGTSAAGAARLCQEGVRMARSGSGYFGRGFYAAADAALAQSNYADLAQHGAEGVVLAVRIAPNARILDLRLEADCTRFHALTRDSATLQRADLPAYLQGHGIDGLFDRAIGGVVLYNERVAEVLGAIAWKPAPAAAKRLPRP